MKNFLKILVVLSILLLSASTVYAATITVSGLPSKAGYGYSWTTQTFENYCPLCGASGSLIYHTGSYKGTYVPEGELSCTCCGADYCAVSGLDKAHTVRASLVKAEVIQFKMVDLFPHINYTSQGTIYS